MKDKEKLEVVEEICRSIRDFTDVAVVGMSGGADSSLVAALCVNALGKENVFGVHMPANELDEKTFNSRSESLAKKLGINSLTVSCGDIANAICSGVESVFPGETLQTVNSGNARSRARMTLLYGISHHLSNKLGKRVRVIGTGNLSEDFIGYDTKGGDALADLFPIGELVKSEVYELLEFFRDHGVIEEGHIDRVPSAGLWDGQTDEQELGYSYASMELIVKRLSRKYPSYQFGSEIYDLLYSDNKIDKNLLLFILGRHSKNKHKHEAPPVVLVRYLIEDEDKEEDE